MCVYVCARVTYVYCRYINWVNSVISPQIDKYGEQNRFSNLLGFSSEAPTSAVPEKRDTYLFIQSKSTVATKCEDTGLHILTVSTLFNISCLPKCI